MHWKNTSEFCQMASQCDHIIITRLHNKNIKLATESDLLWKVSYFAALAHRSSEERMLQRDVEAPTGDADI